MTSEQQAAQGKEAESFEENREYKCPECGGVAHRMGIDFKAPRKSDLKAWHEAQEFIQAGKVNYRGVK